MNEKMLERKEEILKAATFLFSQNGYKETDVQQIADTLRLGKGTIYRYFPTKKELFLAAVDRAMHLMQKSVEKEIQDEQESIARVKKALKAYISFIKNNPDLTELFVQERAEFRFREVPTYFSHRKQRNEQWKEAFTTMLKQGKIRCHHFEKTSDTLSNLLYGIIFTKIFQEDKESFEDLANHSVDMILYGLFTNPPECTE